MVDRVVVGGGFAGLMAAWGALERSETVVVLEGSPHLGGAVGRTKLQGFSADTGAEAFSTMGTTVGELVDELGLGHLVEEPAPRAPVIASAAGHLPIPRGVLGIPASLDELAATGHMDSTDIERARALDGVALHPEWATWSVAEIVRERLGDVFLTRVVRPVMGAIYGPRSLECTLEELIPSFAHAVAQTGSLVGGAELVRGSSAGPGSAVATLRGGLHTLIDATAARLERHGVRIVTSAQVEGLTRDGASWAVRTPTETFVTPALTLACGAPSTQALLTHTPRLRELASDIHWHDTTIALALVEDESLSAFPLGSGALVAEDLAGDLQATTHANAKWNWVNAALAPGRHLLRFSFGSRPPGPDAEVEQAVGVALREVYGSDPAHLVETRITRWASHLIGIYPGYRQRSRDLGELAAAEGIDLAGSLVSGNGLLGIARDALGRDRT